MNSTLYKASYRLLLSLVRILIRKRVTVNEFVQIVKKAYIDVAGQYLMESEGKATTSRMAVMTGLTRREVAQLRKSPVSADTISTRFNRVNRVINGWLEDEDFCTEDGYPEVLLIHGKSGSFESLVQRYSGNMTTKSVLDELEALQVVRRIEKEHIALQRRAYVTAGDESETLALLGEDVSLLIGTFDYNLTSKDKLRFQRKVRYDNLPEDCLEEFQAFAAQDSQQLLERFNTWLRKYDRDTNPEARGKGRKRAGVGIYYFEEDVVAEKDDLEPDS